MDIQLDMTQSSLQRKNLSRELSCFIVAGILATLTDFIIYWFLHFILFYSVAKTISFCIGSIVAFLLNKFFTFKKHERSTQEIIRFALLYFGTMIANVCTNDISLTVLKSIFSYLPQGSIIILSFLAATGVSTILNFLGQKFWVFKIL